MWAIPVIVVLVIAIVIFLMHSKKNTKKTKTDEKAIRRKIPETVEGKFNNPIEADRRKHSTMDAPMIR